MNYQLEALIINSDTTGRFRLRQAAAAADMLFKKVYQAADFNHALKALDGMERPIDVCFISENLAQHISKLTGIVKRHMRGELAAVIMVTENQEQVNAMMAKNVIQGIDGFLMEPFSVDALTSICELAVKIRATRTKEKQKNVLKALVKEMVLQLDNAAQLKAAGFKANVTFKVLKEMTNGLDELDEELREEYFNLLIECTQVTTAPKVSYSGASERIKKRMLAKVHADVERVASMPELKLRSA